MMDEYVSIVEVGPRDGLQNEKQIIPSQDKINLVNLLSQCGFKTIEVTSFVSPKWVPQLADAAEVMAGITRHPKIKYAVLTPNLRGYEGARQAQASEVAIFAAASETFSQKNINCSIDESLERFKVLVDQAHADGIPVRGYISCVVDCPYEGQVNSQSTARVAEKLINLGCYEISLGDTTGKGTPQSIGQMLDTVLDIIPLEKLAGHYHDTNGRALENIELSLDLGLRRFDSAIGGLGGCPYAPGAKGNVDTAKVVQLMKHKGFTTGIDESSLNQAAQFVNGFLNRS